MTGGEDAMAGRKSKRMANITATLPVQLLDKIDDGPSSGLPCWGGYGYLFQILLSNRVRAFGRRAVAAY